MGFSNPPLAAGGTITGDLTISDPGVKAYRLRRSGSNLDFDAAGADMFLSVFTTAAFGGTQRNYARLESGAQLLHLLGKVIVAASAFGSAVHTIDPAGNASFDGLVALGKNGLANVRFCGFKNSAGAPVADTWVTGDAVIDSLGLVHVNTAGGTPGTWT